jgi:carboxylesterase type B
MRHAGERCGSARRVCAFRSRLCFWISSAWFRTECRAIRTGGRFYYFTDVGHSESCIKLGAFHGIEGHFITGWFSWHLGEITADDQQMIDLMTGYWTQFAKAGDPNRAGLPPWPKYDTKTDQVQEIGREVKQRPTPHADRFEACERSLDRRLSLLGNDQAEAAQTK